MKMLQTGLKSSLNLTILASNIFGKQAFGNRLDDQDSGGFPSS
jgi:hypothetical protein